MDKKAIAKSLEQIADLIETGENLNKPTIAITNFLSELGLDNINDAIKASKDIANIIIIGQKFTDEYETYEASTDEDNNVIIDKLFKEGKIDAAITMHYPFPVGVSTVGKIKSPANGKDIYIANTTGTNDINREKAMILNAIDGIIAAKANGIDDPTIGILNIEGARIVEKNLKKLKDNGFDITFAESKRSDGGVIFRGNDLVAGTSDIVVTDSLTGNILVKSFASFTSGGFYETTGAGYGPSIGEGYYTPVFIVSRASGTPVIIDAIKYAVDSLKGDINRVSKEVFEAANKAGLKEILEALDEKKSGDQNNKKEVSVPEKEIVTKSIGGIDILEIDDALLSLYKENIYAESAMGCTGPVIMIADHNEERVREILRENNFIE